MCTFCPGPRMERSFICYRILRASSWILCPSFIYIDGTHIYHWLPNSWASSVFELYKFADDSVSDSMAPHSGEIIIVLSLYITRSTGKNLHVFSIRITSEMDDSLDNYVTSTTSWCKFRIGFHSASMWTIMKRIEVKILIRLNLWAAWDLIRINPKLFEETLFMHINSCIKYKYNADESEFNPKTFFKPPPYVHFYGIQYFDPCVFRS